MDLYNKLISAIPKITHWKEILFTITGILSFFKWGINGLCKIFRWIAKKFHGQAGKSEDIRIVPWQRGGSAAWWHMGEMENKPAMQVVSYWYVTNLSDQPLLLLNSEIKHAAISMLSVQHPENDVFGEYPILPKCTSEVIIDFWIQPPRCKEGKDYKTDIVVTDQLSRKHKIKNIVFHYK